ncbi:MULTISPECIES: hypothetical protein [Asticcacaulis]|uniref:hypothetical protein n=1 Tax=Asticcacaulis TaxID=76890 RepID=UPI001AEB720C|nr:MULTISPECIES: hypothetical protein [Asticcacaulis]MBP2157821.1 hypothetical protein [Asticcacaulis solisilvae]MDR6798866.1 hypothetical protein [Asticcacaulis sp. BE141]
MEPYRFKVFVDHERRVLTVRVIGLMPSAEFVDRLFEAYGRIDKPWTYNRIMDFRRFDGQISEDYIEEMGRRWHAMVPPGTPRSKLAVVSCNPLDRTRTPSVSPAVPSRAICHFSDFHSAVRWISSQDQAAPKEENNAWSVTGTRADLHLSDDVAYVI